MYRITFVVDAFKGPHQQELSHEILNTALKALTRINVAHLKANPEIPPLYASGVRYEEEPVGQEDWQDCLTCLNLKVGDCLPLSTLVLKSDYSAVPLGSLSPGDLIMGDGEWTQVTEAGVTGEKPILAFELDNGCVLRCSPEHRLFVDDGGREVRAEDVRVGQRLACPSKAFPVSAPWRPVQDVKDADLAWLVGVYVADGWHDKLGHRFSISGDDETPKRGKREQKDRVVDIMSRLGVDTRRHKKYVAVNDRTLTQLMLKAGSHGPNKRVPSMLLSEEQVRAVLEGLQTDSSLANSGTITYGTTSPELSLQLRILHRMLDQSVHVRRWDEHGGLGKHPIYRVGLRRDASEDAPKNWKTRAEQYKRSVRVRAVREEDPELCGDITTTSGRFYLPESDTVVHNCEDLAAWRAAEIQVRSARRGISPPIMAWPTFTFKRKEDGGYLYHIIVRWPDDPRLPRHLRGAIEDPSRRLGMK